MRTVLLSGIATFLLLALIGNSSAQPQIQVEPLEIEPWPRGEDEEMAWNEVTIRNLGNEVLSFEIRISYNRGEDWLGVRPRDGNVDPGGESYVEVAYVRPNWDDAGIFGADIHILNSDPNNADVVVRYHVELYGVISISLQANWNLISIHYEPFHNDIVPLFSDIRYRLIIVKDAQGRFYLPARNFNNIPLWDFRQGYLVKMSGPADFYVGGYPVPEDTPIPLRCGWNIVAYFPRSWVEAPDAFRNIADDLIMVKDGDGHFYIPARGFNNIPPLHRGAGYQLKVSRDIELIWWQP